jgi:hypothetical protein
MAVTNGAVGRVVRSVISFFKKWSESIALSRQLQANRMLAELTIHEYREEHTVDSLHSEINKRTIEKHMKRLEEINA